MAPADKRPLEQILELRWSGWERPTPKIGERTEFSGEGKQDGTWDNYFLTRQADRKLYVIKETTRGYKAAEGEQPITVTYPADQFVKTDSRAIQALRQFGYDFDRDPR
jgi:hypothetical protein